MKRLERIGAVTVLLYVIASFVSCSPMVTVHQAPYPPTATGCEWGQKQCSAPGCSKPDCAYTADCSKRGRKRWPVCIEDPRQLCRTRRAVTECGPGIGHDCYHAAGTSNCEQLWAYEP